MGEEYGEGPGRWFQDRRFTLTSPANRIRRNVTQMISDVQQVARQNPELLGMINQQLALINQISSGTPAQTHASPPPPPPIPPHHHTPPNFHQPFARSSSTPYDHSAHQRRSRMTGEEYPGQVALEMDPGPTPGPSTSLFSSPPTLPRAQSTPSTQDALDVADLGLEDSSEDEDTPNTTTNTPPAQPAQPPPPEGGDDWRRLLELIQSAEMRVWVSMGLRALPYAALFLFKLFLQHVGGLVGLVFLFLGQQFANRILLNFVARRNGGRRFDLVKVGVTLGLWLAVFLALTVEEELWRVLVFLSSGLDYEVAGHVDLSNVLWVVLAGDCLASYACILLKLPIALVPVSHLDYRRKARWYQMLEYSGLAWRHWIPVRPWAAYFLSSVDPRSTRLGRSLHHLLFIAYFLTKLVHFLPKLGTWMRSVRGVMSGGALGFRASSEEVKAADHCSICYSTFTHPLKLSCKLLRRARSANHSAKWGVFKHVFCGECIGQWLEREATCPMCRATVTDDPKWRDGATSLAPQLF